MTSETLSNSQEPKSSSNITAESLASSVEKVSLQDDFQSEFDNDDSDKKKTQESIRPLYIYTRSQILHLHKSPLVKPPEGMPALKDWFGLDHEQAANKKETELAVPTSARDRRFRRDPEDGEPPPRPSFRSSLSQPSQMGNFKHQSSRTNDRDRDEKEGQERLRNLADKYDRERLALPSINGLRNKERESAPHLTSGSSSRLNSQGQLPANSSRRTDSKEQNGKKKIGESTEDWRRGAEPPRSARDDRSDTTRKDREERPRSRVRESSRSRQDATTSRRDRDEKDRDRDRRGEREDYRRDDYPRHDRDTDDLEDPRRWRDDGKRDERIAARRDKEYRDRIRDKVPHDSGPSDADRRWTVVEERDGRSKRSSGRDRRPGALEDERKDREREKEKEKEPAWMDTYIPSGSIAGILGGKSAEGELDGIQAWKKGMKEKEQREKGIVNGTGANATSNDIPAAEKPDTTPTAKPEKQLDEIQLFKLLMKREEDKKKAAENPQAPSSEQHPSQSTIENGVVTKDSSKASPSSETPSHTVSPTTGTTGVTLANLIPKGPSSNITLSTGATTPTPSDGPLSLLSILSPAHHDSNSGLSPQHPQPPNGVSDVPKPGSRFFPNPLSSQNLTLPIPQTTNSSEPLGISSPAPSQYNPPQGSRLLAFARAPSSASSIQPPKSHTPNGHSPSSIQSPPGLQHSYSNHALQEGSLGQSSPDIPFNHRPAISDAIRTQQGFSPFEDPSRSSYGIEHSRDQGNFANSSDALRRASVVSSADRVPYADSAPSYNDSNAGKGSRFAKFFDGKGAGVNKGPNQPGFNSTSIGLGQRQDPGAFNGMIGDNRTMDDIFTMLNNSAQGQRLNPAVQIGGPPFGQVHNLQHQQIAQQHLAQNSRHDPLYDSRLDDRHFVPDGMVPGLRTVPQPRSRESSGMYEGLDDPMQFQRLQRGNVDPMYAGPGSSPYGQQGRNAGLPLQQPHYRGGPSPNPGPGQQRLPPGLANLGGRPPHEPSQFIGAPMGLGSAGLHGPMHGNGPQQQFNNFGVGNGLGFGGGPQMRGAPPPHQLQNPLLHGSMGHPGNMDLRGPNQAQLLAMSGGGVGNGLRGGGGFSGPQQGPNAQMQAPLLAMRQQQQHAPPHMIPHMLPPHMQQQGLPGPNNQPAHDLMALLMGGPHRE